WGRSTRRCGETLGLELLQPLLELVGVGLILRRLLGPARRATRSRRPRRVLRFCRSAPVRPARSGASGGVWFSARKELVEGKPASLRDCRRGRRWSGRRRCWGRGPAFLAEHGVEGDVVLGRMRWLAKRGGRSGRRFGDVERGVQRSLRRRNGRRRAASRPDTLEERLRRNTGALLRRNSTRELRHLRFQPGVGGTLREQRLIDAQRILLMALLQIQVGHRLGHDRLRLRERRGISGAVVIGKRDRRRNRSGDSAPPSPPARRNVVRHDERQIDLWQSFLELRRGRPLGWWRGVQIEHPAAFVLRTSQPLDLHLLDLLRIQLDILLHFQTIGLRAACALGLKLIGVSKFSTSFDGAAAAGGGLSSTGSTVSLSTVKSGASILVVGVSIIEGFEPALALARASASAASPFIGSAFRSRVSHSTSSAWRPLRSDSSANPRRAMIFSPSSSRTFLKTSRAAASSFL